MATVSDCQCLKLLWYQEALAAVAVPLTATVALSAAVPVTAAPATAEAVLPLPQPPQVALQPVSLHSAWQELCH